MFFTHIPKRQSLNKCKRHLINDFSQFKQIHAIQPFHKQPSKPKRWKKSQSRRHTFLVSSLHPLQVWKVRFDLRVILGLMVEMTERDLHAAKLALKHRRTGCIRARVMLAGGPSLLHAGWMVQWLGFTVSIAGSLTWVHAVFPTTLHRVASNACMRHLIHVWYAVVHHGWPQQGTIKNAGSILRIIGPQKRNIFGSAKYRASSHVG